MQEKADIVLGYAATGIGATGAAFQLWGDVGSALVIGLNVILAVGGLSLLRMRRKIAKLDLAKAEHDKAGRLEREADERGDTRDGE